MSEPVKKTVVIVLAFCSAAMCFMRETLAVMSSESLQ